MRLKKSEKLSDLKQLNAVLQKLIHLDTTERLINRYLSTRCSISVPWFTSKLSKKQVYEF